MIYPLIPENETARLQELKSFKILDSFSEQDYDDITKLASEICQTPISLITLIDEKRQWFKSHHGLNISETPRHEAFCAHGILNPSEPLIVPNAHEDARFKDNPLVLGEPKIDFYAGIPLVTEKGLALGSLCVIDSVPHDISPDQVDALRILARQVINMLELRRKVHQLSLSKTQLIQTNENLQEFARILAHDIKAPIRNMRMFAEIIIEDFEDELNEDVIERLQHIIKSAKKSKQYINGILAYSKATFSLSQEKQDIDLNLLVADIAYQLTPPDGITISYPTDLPTIHSHYIPLQIILTNLVGNAVKYNDKEVGLIRIEVDIKGDHAFFSVKDNGRGIPERHIEKIFSLFYMIEQDISRKKDSNGIGLSIVKKLIKSLGGEITVSSVEKEGSLFKFSIPL